jgi:hypothetical protein
MLHGASGTIVTNTFSSERTGQKTFEHLLREFNARDKIACGGACVKDANCSSAEFNIFNSTCSLFSYNLTALPLIAGSDFVRITPTAGW